MLLSVPVAALMSRNPVPAFVIGFSALGILGTGMAVQLVTLPTEFDASFNKAMSMLEDGYVDNAQLSDARMILVACSLTYAASSLASVLNVWYERTERCNSGRTIAGDVRFQAGWNRA